MLWCFCIFALLWCVCLFDLMWCCFLLSLCCGAFVFSLRCSVLSARCAVVILCFRSTVMFWYFRYDVVLLSVRCDVVLWSLEANVALQQRLRAHVAAVLRVVLAWKRSVCVLCSSAVDEPSSSADALQHCLQSLVGVRPSVLCSSARAGAQAVLWQAVLTAILCASPSTDHLLASRAPLRFDYHQRPKMSQNWGSDFGVSSCVSEVL